MLELTIRLVVSLAIVVGLLLVLARFGARKFKGNSEALVHVVHRQPLSRTSAVAVVTVGTRVLVLGTTEQQVSVLAELDPDELEITDADFSSLVEEGALAPVSKPLALVVDEPGFETGPAGLPQLTEKRVPGSHRAAPSPRTTATPAAGALSGSILSPQTWKQAFSAARRAS